MRVCEGFSRFAGFSALNCPDLFARLSTAQINCAGASLYPAFSGIGLFLVSIHVQREKSLIGMELLLHPSTFV